MIYASRFKRGLAYLIDLVVIISFTFLSMLQFLPDVLEVLTQNLTISVTTIDLLLIFRGLIITLIFVCMYSTFVPLLLKGQTFGKKLLGIRIINADGTEPNFTTYFVREVIGKLLFNITSLGVATLVSGLLIVQNEQKTLHDALSSTLVVVKK